MAGIGFELRKLAQKDDLLGVLHAYSSAALAAAGPWLFTVLALGGITMMYSDSFAMKGLLNFRVITIYNFAFSLCLSAPVFMVVTRHLADHIHVKNVTHTPSIMLFSLALLYMIELPFAGWYYLVYTDMELSLRISALVNVFLITSVWTLGVYMTALKDYNAVSLTFGVGMVVAFLMGQLLKDSYSDVGMLNGFNIGLTIIVFGLAAKVIAEYNYKLAKETTLKETFKKYWELAVGGVLYNAAIWVDKWIMWYAPESWELPTKMRMYPDYDTAMFLAYLTIVPALAMFVFSVETNFFERYQKFYDQILSHMPLKRIRENHDAIIDSIISSSRNFIVVQGTICIACILLAPQIFDLVNLNWSPIGMFRLGTLGAFFHVLMLFGLVILSYFDNRKMVMYIQGTFLLLNILFTLVTLKLGVPWYGYGYFLSCLLTFVITVFTLFTYMKKLPYHAFITSNNSVAHNL